MYEWRKMTERERREALSLRKTRHLPWHGPPCNEEDEGTYHLSAACYEHAPCIGVSPERMAECEEQLLIAISAHAREIHAWCVLPNHYHVLVSTESLKTLKQSIGRFHGRQSYIWNLEDANPGRKVWHGCADRKMRSLRHFWTSTNYIHNNPVRHGYVMRWQDWPYTSAHNYLEQIGPEEALRIWREFPPLDYGAGWDD
jgi:putative transposase